jgi:hypothetical protein
MAWAQRETLALHCGAAVRSVSDRDQFFLTFLDFGSFVPDAG